MIAAKSSSTVTWASLSDNGRFAWGVKRCESCEGRLEGLGLAKCDNDGCSRRWRRFGGSGLGDISKDRRSIAGVPGWDGVGISTKLMPSNAMCSSLMGVTTCANLVEGLLSLVAVEGEVENSSAEGLFGNGGGGVDVDVLLLASRSSSDSTSDGFRDMLERPLEGELSEVFSRSSFDAP